MKILFFQTCGLEIWKVDFFSKIITFNLHNLVFKLGLVEKAVILINCTEVLSVLHIIYLISGSH